MNGEFLMPEPNVGPKEDPGEGDLSKTAGRSATLVSDGLFHFPHSGGLGGAAEVGAFLFLVELEPRSPATIFSR